MYMSLQRLNTPKLKSIHAKRWLDGSVEKHDPVRSLWETLLSGQLATLSPPPEQREP